LSIYTGISGKIRLHFEKMIIMFISFAPPKEMNQRKRGRKKQPVPLAALRVGTGSHLLPSANSL